MTENQDRCRADDVVRSLQPAAEYWTGAEDVEEVAGDEGAAKASDLIAISNGGGPGAFVGDVSDAAQRSSLASELARLRERQRPVVDGAVRETS